MDGGFSEGGKAEPRLLAFTHDLQRVSRSAVVGEDIGQVWAPAVLLVAALLDALEASQAAGDAQVCCLLGQVAA